jgi:hypothetical protein
MATASNAIEKRGFGSRIAPALTLAFMAPMLAELLPGATRFSSIFVFPIEMMVWGGGAVMIRELVRRNGLGWANMLALALCLAIAEEWLIQQTSLAPLVIQLKGVEYARAFGINYVYLLWALVYESVLVVFLPVMLVELLFPSPRNARWLSTAGWVVQLLFFALGAFFAWFTWTQIARVKVFHLAAYNPPLPYILIALGAIALLMVLALGPTRRALANLSWRINPVHPAIPALGGAVWGVLWFGLTVLSFGIMPSFPPALAMALGLGIAALLIVFGAGFAGHPAWNDRYRAWTVAGTMIATMAVFQQAFVGATPADSWFKTGSFVLATILLLALVVKVSRRPGA